METYNRNTDVAGHQSGSNQRSRPCSGRVWGGLFIVIIGVLLLARRTGLDIPDWIFSIESFLIALGLYIGLRHSFKRLVWIIPVAIGGFLLLDDFYPHYDLGDFTWPLIIIGFGLFIMLRSSRRRNPRERYDTSPVGIEQSSEDKLDSTVVFGGAKKIIISKNFQGGEVVTVFGGTELNFMQAELAGPVVLELTQVFGGTKLIVPPHWKVQTNEMVAVFGGIDDKRPIVNNPDADNNQMLILQGTCLMGGVDIRSY